MIRKIINYIKFFEYRIYVQITFLNRYQNVKCCKVLAYLLRRHLIKKYNIIFGNEAVLGSKVVFPHPHNIVIGKKVIIGNNCTIYHDVTFGQNRDKYPQIGDNVIVYAGAKVIGDIHIGNNAIIGTNAVVTSSVPENAIVAGIPAKIIKYRSENDEFY